MLMYQTVTLSTKPQKISNPFVRSLKVIHGTIPQAVAHPSWGIDPGVNFGLTVIKENKVWVFHGSLISDPTPGRQGLIAYKFLETIIRQFYHTNALLVIEGAAYGAPFRQVELSEIRTAFYLAASLTQPIPVSAPFFSDVVIKPPATIRKEVFGSGKTQAGDEFPLLNHNAADALSMALYAAQMEDG
jgi:hypothetical protein